MAVLSLDFVRWIGLCRIGFLLSLDFSVFYQGWTFRHFFDLNFIFVQMNEAGMWRMIFFCVILSIFLSTYAAEGVLDFVVFEWNMMTFSLPYIPVRSCMDSKLCVMEGELPLPSP